MNARETPTVGALRTGPDRAMATMRAHATFRPASARHRAPASGSKPRAASTASSRTSRAKQQASKDRARRLRFGALAPDAEAVAGDGHEEERDDVTPLDNVCFVLCRPQGPQNIGGIARVMQNFGVTDLRIVAPEPGALAPPFDAADEYDRAIHPPEERARAPLSDEAHKFAVHADWLLRDARRCATADEALADVAFVAATTARPRENLSIADVRAAAEVLRRHAANGTKVAVVFGNEATGLTNDELARANLGVMIATSSGKASSGKGSSSSPRKRYTGAKGSTSLNLSMAVGVVAYELFQAMGDGEVSGFGSRLMTVDERIRLADELAGARRSLDVLRRQRGSASGSGSGFGSNPPGALASPDGANTRGGSSIGNGADGGYDGDATTTTTSEEDRLLDEKEARAIARVLNAGPIATKDAAVLFQLARRTRSVEAYSGVDEAVVDAAMDLFARADAAGKPRPGNKTVLNHVRDALGLSLTTRELERVVTAAGAVDPAEERLNRRSEGEFL